MNHRVLIIEDEKEIADTLSYAISSAGLTSTWVSTGSDAKQLLGEEEFSLCVLDVGLPDCHGFDLLKEIRQSKSSFSLIPVLFLTAHREEIDRILGLELGADDYVCKPFSPREVVARIKTILNRSEPRTSTETLNSQTKNLSNPFDHRPEQRQVFLENSRLDLTRAEYTLLTTFLERPSQVFSRRQLIEIIWSSNHPSDDRAIDTHIKTLRAKLKTSNPHQDYIITHRGFGYSLELNKQS